MARFSFQRRTDTRGLFGDKKMSKSPAQREEMAQELLAAEQQAGQERKSSAVKQLEEHSSFAGRIPASFKEGVLHRAADFDQEGFAQAWGRGEEDSHQVSGAIERIARNLDTLVERLHSEDGDGEDQSGHSDENVRGLVGDLRREARLGSRVPAALVEGWLSFALAHDENAVEAIRNRESNPAGYEDFVRRAGFALNKDAVALETATKPSTKLPKGVDVGDLADMDEREFQKIVRQHRAAQAAVKKGRK
jgi:hypothetical protein